MHFIFSADIKTFLNKSAEDKKEVRAPDVVIGMYILRIRTRGIYIELFYYTCRMDHDHISKCDGGV